MANAELPGRGLLGWLGRQAGYVRKAVVTPVEPETRPDAVVFQSERVEEAELPGKPGVVLRRTTRDEVVIRPTRAEES